MARIQNIMVKKHVIFDREGTLIKYIPYVFMVKDIQLKKGVKIF